MSWKHVYRRKRDDFYRWLARCVLPRRFVYICFVQVWADGTCGPYGHTVVSEVTAMELAKRYKCPE